MIIQSIRLKNIKSYGNGPNGDGVVIPFERGVNLVAGRNGQGKTTLIESLGYALFLTEPQFEENFQRETYFLRSGEKEGEIDVTLECEGISYRIERAVGKQSKRRDKVVQINDQSICAEGVVEVANFICRLLGIPDRKNLNEIFSKLVGVKQGRLSWPFDSKPADAKRYFEPLMEVEVFRNCFDQLKGVVDIFEKQLNEQNVKLSALNERIQERADSEQKFTQSSEKVYKMKFDLVILKQACDEAEKVNNQLEVLGDTVSNAVKAKELAEQKSKHAKQLRKTAEDSFTESVNATKVLETNEKAYNDYSIANEKLSELEEQRNIRDGIKQQRDKVEKNRAKCQADCAAARELVEMFTPEHQKKKKDLDELNTKIKPVKEELDNSADKFKKSLADADEAEKHRETVVLWVERLKDFGKTQGRQADNISNLAKEISVWDDTKIKATEKLEEETAKVLKDNQNKLAKAEERQQTLKEQLEEIRGGICPFVKEKCRQFDPAKVKADLQQQAASILILKDEEETAQTNYRNIKRTLDKLREDKGIITSKESDLAKALEQYIDNAQDLLADEEDKSIQWLLRWEKLSAVSDVVKVSGPKLNLAQVVILQKELELYVQNVEEWWAKSDDIIKIRLKAFEEEKEKRQSQQTTLKRDIRDLDTLKEYAGELKEKSAGKEDETKNHKSKTKNLIKQIVKFDQKLSAHAYIDDDIKKEQAYREKNKKGYDLYVGAKKLADEMPARQTQFTGFKKDEITAEEALKAATDDLSNAKQSFDPEKLKAAKTDQLNKRDSVTTLTEKLNSEKALYEQVKNRFEELQKAKKEHEQASNEAARCQAAKKITELSRTILRDVAPFVAQHLCSRIADRAQTVFNQINPDPVELEWDAERYSLRVIPGDRRFAMLSGGEQTKLALALTLAMIEEFSHLRFCIFDEPTYGVDADSRHKLADAILQAQKTANLDQLILVSHDDAFEGKIEHTTLLENVPGRGTDLLAVN